MKHKVFAVYDEKAKAYLTPFFLPEAGMAKRTFGDCVNDPQHQFGLHPADYTLFELAVWNLETGVLHPHDAKLSHGNGVEFKSDSVLQSAEQIDLVEQLENGEDKHA